MKHRLSYDARRLVSLVSCVLLLWSCFRCEANLGETPEQIKARYGAAVFRFSDGGTFRFRRPGMEAATVDVSFQSGKSQSEKFNYWKSKALKNIDSTGPVSRTEIDAILKANAQNLTWRPQEITSRGSPGDRTWILGSSDLKTAVAKAVTNDEHHLLRISLMTYKSDQATDGKAATALTATFPMPEETPLAADSPRTSLPINEANAAMPIETPDCPRN